MIRAICFTNLDEYQGECWPQVFACVPRVGDSVESRDGKRLRVHAVIHRELPDSSTPVPQRMLPNVRVELHL